MKHKKKLTSGPTSGLDLWLLGALSWWVENFFEKFLTPLVYVQNDQRVMGRGMYFGVPTAPPGTLSDPTYSPPPPLQTPKSS